MRKIRLDLVYLISLGLASAFLASVLRNFFYQASFNELIESSFFSEIFSAIPYFIYIVAFNDFLVAVLLMLRIFPKVAAWWAMLWLLAVIIVHVSVFSLEDLLDAIEHMGLLAMAIFLVIKSRKQTIVDSPSTSSLSA
ncbi:MAG: hypothetical protein AAB583_03270 [Patescibacteria group bacterium]